MIIKRRIYFKLRAFGRKTIRYQIRMRFSFLGYSSDITVGYNLDTPDGWDDEHQMVKDGFTASDGTDSGVINMDMKIKRDQLDSVFKFFEAVDKVPTLAEVTTRYENRMAAADGRVVQKIGTVKQIAEPKPPKEKKEEFFDIYSMFLADSSVKNSWSEGTYKKFSALKKDFEEFDPKCNLAGFDDPRLTKFVTFLRDQKKLRKPRRPLAGREDYEEDDIKGLSNTTIFKKLGYLKWFFRWADDHGFSVNPAYKTYNPSLKSTQKKVIYLTKDELNRLRALNLEGDMKRLQPTLDVFIFSCFSGLRYSDLLALKKTDVKDISIEVTTIKTADTVSIDLNDVTRSILEKYHDAPFPDDRALPVYTNQAMNRDIKELAKLADINEKVRITTYRGSERIDQVFEKSDLITIHCGRRTFVVMALSMGIPPNIVMKWTGHSDYKAMKPYIDIVDSIKASEMTKFNNL